VAGPGVARTVILAGLFGFGALGFLDDVLGGDAERGWRAHVRALAAGRLSADGALVALAANLGNAFDRAPGRTIKVSLVAWVPLALAARGGAAGVALGPVVGAALGLLPEDLGERLMLGDAGANALGAALGLGALLTLGPGARLVLLSGLAVLNVAADVVSF